MDVFMSNLLGWRRPLLPAIRIPLPAFRSAAAPSEPAPEPIAPLLTKAEIRTLVARELSAFPAPQKLRRAAR